MQGGQGFHGRGDYRGRDLRVGLSRELAYGIDVRLTYLNAAYARRVTGATLRGRGAGDPLAVGSGGVDRGAFDQYVQGSAVLVGLARDTRLFGPVHGYTAAAAGLYAERRKDLTSAHYRINGGESELIDVTYELSAFRTPALNIDLGLLYQYSGLSVGPYASVQFAGEGAGTTAIGLLLRVAWPTHEAGTD